MPSYNSTSSNFRTRTSRSTSNRYSGYGRSNNRSKGGKRGKQYIDPAKFIKTAKPITIEEYTPRNKFSDFEVNDTIKQNLADRGFQDPTPIQDQSIEAILEGRDLIGIANTGTGKTAAFAIPVLHNLMQDRNSRALIVAPTRELAQQIEQECRLIARKSGIRGALIIGGSSMGIQLRDLRDKPSVVIGTPGRLIDHINRGTLQLDSFNHVILDEVDRMLDMGFIDDVRSILSELPEERQSLYFSATMENKVRTLIETFSNDPAVVSLRSSNTSDNVHQNVVHYNHSGEKIDKLHDILNKDDVTKIIIFDETQRSVERLSDELVSRGFNADAIHGGKTQGQRERALGKFKKNAIDILVATDVAARGIDVPNVSHVINYTTPQSYEDYVHRIGRAGRAGKVGYALTFVTR